LTTNPLFTPFRLGPVTLRNRIVKAATFEGMCAGGEVSDALVACTAGSPPGAPG
jgi:2,4-dienoyl-CoA reductase-like NADH-dependent reductase (Old Yellow Enzyme family)